MTTLNTIISGRLKKLMEVKSIKNGRQFAIALDIDASQFNKILNGEMALPYKHAVKISNQYGVPVNWVLGGDVPDPLEIKTIDTLIPAGVQISAIEDDISAIVNNAKLTSEEKIEILSIQLNIERLANAELRAKLLLNNRMPRV